MPSYEITLIVRSLAKPALVDNVVRATSSLLECGAVVKDITSLGHRDLPMRRAAHGLKHYAANYILLDVQAPLATVRKVRSEMDKQKDVLSFYWHEAKPQPYIQCTLQQELQPAVHRPSVLALRDTAKQTFWTRRKAFANARDTYKSIPKSYPIPIVRS